ncbi:Protein of unknown function [Gryllus bimaculatus]|nr:Protein of unknown function [Gryllus bimaculatus]
MPASRSVGRTMRGRLTSREAATTAARLSRYVRRARLHRPPAPPPAARLAAPRRVTSRAMTWRKAARGRRRRRQASWAYSRDSRWLRCQPAGAAAERPRVRAANGLDVSRRVDPTSSSPPLPTPRRR